MFLKSQRCEIFRKISEVINVSKIFRVVKCFKKFLELSNSSEILKLLNISKNF